MPSSQARWIDGSHCGGGGTVATRVWASPEAPSHAVVVRSGGELASVYRAAIAAHAGDDQAVASIHPARCPSARIARDSSAHGVVAGTELPGRSDQVGTGSRRTSSNAPSSLVGAEEVERVDGVTGGTYPQRLSCRSLRRCHLRCGRGRAETCPRGMARRAVSHARCRTE